MMNSNYVTWLFNKTFVYYIYGVQTTKKNI